MITCVDLFSGCGGMSLGFKMAGINIVAAMDNWDKAVEVYKKNFDHPCCLVDLKDVDKCIQILQKYKPEMIIGGPPCQDFSSAGHRDETKGRADLTYSFADIISRYKPSWFVMENVERIKRSQILNNICDQLSATGYGLTAVILNASYCNVPQARKRFFLIGQLDGEHNQLESLYLKNLNKQQMTVRDYLGDSLGTEFYYRHPRNYTRRGVFSIDEPSPTVRGVNRPIPKNYPGHPGDKADVKSNKVRPLTTIERSYIQTFPKSFKFVGTKTDLEQMIGNAVPVNLAKFVAEGILEFTQSKGLPRDLSDLFGFDELKIPTSSLERFRA